MIIEFYDLENSVLLDLHIKEMEAFPIYFKTLDNYDFLRLNDVKASTSTGKEASELYQQFKPDVVLI